MRRRTHQHANDRMLLDFHLGLLTKPQQVLDLATHLQTCESCCERLEALSSGLDTADNLVTTSTDEPFRPLPYSPRAPRPRRRRPRRRPSGSGWVQGVVVGLGILAVLLSTVPIVLSLQVNVQQASNDHRALRASSAGRKPSTRSDPPAFSRYFQKSGEILQNSCVIQRLHVSLGKRGDR